MQEHARQAAGREHGSPAPAPQQRHGAARPDGGALPLQASPPAPARPAARRTCPRRRTAPPGLRTPTLPPPPRAPCRRRRTAAARPPARPPCTRTARPPRCASEQASTRQAERRWGPGGRGDGRRSPAPPPPRPPGPSPQLPASPRPHLLVAASSAAVRSRAAARPARRCPRSVYTTSKALPSSSRSPSALLRLRRKLRLRPGRGACACGGGGSACSMGGAAACPRPPPPTHTFSSGVPDATPPSPPHSAKAACCAASQATRRCSAAGPTLKCRLPYFSLFQPACKPGGNHYSSPGDAAACLFLGGSPREPCALPGREPGPAGHRRQFIKFTCYNNGVRSPGPAEIKNLYGNSVSTAANAASLISHTNPGTGLVAEGRASKQRRHCGERHPYPRPGQPPAL
jgi:hypothetical protein